MDARSAGVILGVATGIALAAVAGGYAVGVFDRPDASTVTPTATPSTTTSGYGPARVVVSDGNGTRLGVVDARVADTRQEQITGLSETPSLPDGGGMLFVYGDEAVRTFVMRNMSFPLDMVFVGADGRITAIHHAPVPEKTEGDELREYSGRAKWVLEVERGWTAEHDVSVGDTVTVSYEDDA